ncbi:hypothetical protein [Actinoplanes nipponensis]|nr:hypothetical protein [Actinoplanes nipponensis]
MQILFLDWLHDRHPAGNPRPGPPCLLTRHGEPSRDDELLDFLTEPPPEASRLDDFLAERQPEHARDGSWPKAVRALCDDGRLESFPHLEAAHGLTVGLTDKGRRDVVNRRRRRQEPVLRAAAARDQIVRWLYRQPQHAAGRGLFMDGHFEGDPFSAEELREALDYLRRKGLVAGRDGVVRPERPAYPASGAVPPDYPRPHRPRRPPASGVRLTPQGIDCRELYGGSVSDYVRRPESSISVSIPNNQGQVNVGSSGGTQEMVVHRGAIERFTDSVLSELPHSGLDAHDREKLGGLLADLQREAQAAEPDDARISGRFQRLIAYVSEAGKPVLTALLMAAVQGYGLPPA